MSIRPLVGVLAFAIVFAGMHAFSEDLECTRYIPESGMTIHVPCSDATPLTPTAVPQDARAERTILGLTLAPLTPELRDQYKVDSTIDGVLVTDVDARSEAASRGIKRGDVLMQTNEGVVATPDDVMRVLQSAATSGRKTILLLLKNAGGEVAFVALPLG
jgi:S1-C subfamily serine protease